METKDHKRYYKNHALTSHIRVNHLSELLKLKTKHILTLYIIFHITLYLYIKYSYSIIILNIVKFNEN